MGEPQHFQGNLASYRLPLLIPAICESPAAEGTLRVERGAVRRQFFFRGGLLVGGSSSDPREHLGQVLDSLGILEAARAAAAFEEAESVGVRFGTYVVERGLVARPLLVEAMEHKAREALFDCYRWESGEVEFVPGPLPLQRAVELQLPLRSLHRDALSRLNEWNAFHEVFPSMGTTFQVHRQHAGRVTPVEDRMLELAGTGAPLSELLDSVLEGPLHGARWVLHLYRRGVLEPRQPAGVKQDSVVSLEGLLAQARKLMSQGWFESALEVTTQVLERGPVPEAHALYREAEVKLTVALAEHILALDGRLILDAVPRPTPPSLTTDDLYLYSKLRSSRSLREALRHTAMGELSSYRALQRLMHSGVVRVTPEAVTARRTKTHPYGIASMPL